MCHAVVTLTHAEGWTDLDIANSRLSRGNVSKNTIWTTNMPIWKYGAFFF